MEQIIPQSKAQWIDEYKRLGNEYKTNEKNLILSFLQNDYHLSKIYNQLLISEIDQENIHYQTIEKQLKFFINEAFSYILGNKVTKGNLKEFQNKIKKIDDLLIKCQKEYKNKFDILLTEEEKLERELNTLENEFDLEFGKNNSDLMNTNTTDNFNKKETKTEAFIQAQNKRIEAVDTYISNVMNQNNLIYSEDEKNLLLHELKKSIKKFGAKDIEIIKEKTVVIDSIVDKKLGGINLGWQQKEHDEFMKLKINYNNKINSYEFLSALSDLIPYLPRSELKCHIKLYDKFSQLMELKKLLIIRYKEIKAQIEEEEKKKIMENLKQEKIKAANAAKERNNFDPEIIQKKKMKVKEWKEHKKQIEKEMSKKAKKEEIKQKEKEKEKYLIQKQKNQVLIEEYKKKKEIEKENKKLEEQANNQIIYSQSDLNRIYDREEQLLEKRKNGLKQKLAKQAQNNDASLYSRLLIVNKIRPDNKINSVTEAYKNRQRNKFDPNTDKGKDACTMANNLLGKGSRAIPQWRQGL